MLLGQVLQGLGAVAGTGARKVEGRASDVPDLGFLPLPRELGLAAWHGAGGGLLCRLVARVLWSACVHLLCCYFKKLY